MSVPDKAPFTFALRVYYEDTDAQGVVYYANYFRFMERARTEWLRAHGVDQVQLRKESGLIFVVVRTELAFRSPARFDDELAVTANVLDWGGARFVLEQNIYRESVEGDVLCEGLCEGACIDAVTLRPRRLPKNLRSELFS
jgi:acyl-CoA thioester hydrolase